ncbi:MAG: hypothetical protein LLF97_03595 [Planctomycetaceae bacterium]|nr:hypothetical protein [Planctomycetaceae bacterium]
MSDCKIIERFVASVRRRVNRHQLWTTSIESLVVGSAAWIVVGLCYVARGYALPAVWSASILLATVLLAAAVWTVRRMNVERTARFADHFFQLQDAVSSFLHFSSQNHRDGFYALQAAQTADRVAGLDSAAVRYRPPKRRLCLAVGLLAVAVPLSVWPPSDAVLRRMAEQRQIATQTAQLNADLRKEADQLIEETRDPDEQKLIEPDKLREWVERLKTTQDRAEALRQYARLERKVDGLRQSVQRKRDEQLLDRAASELAKDPRTKSMAETLSHKDYRRAADKLKRLKPDPSKSPDQRRRDLAQLKTIAQRMAAARSSAKTSNGETGNESDGALADQIAELAEAMEKLDRLEERQGKLCQCESLCCEKTDKLADTLKKLSICRQLDGRLCKLCRCCSQCQGRMCCNSPNAGGHKAGWGTNQARRDQRDALIDNGQTTQLTGQKSAGPSSTTVEAADSGDGVATRRVTARARAFQHQFESFVQREDVPEAVREGVKQYFQIIHESDNEPSLKKESAP